MPQLDNYYASRLKVYSVTVSRRYSRWQSN